MFEIEAHGEEEASFVLSASRFTGSVVNDCLLSCVVNSRVAVDNCWVPCVVNPELLVVLSLAPVVLVIEVKYEVDFSFLV